MEKMFRKIFVIVTLCIGGATTTLAYDIPVYGVQLGDNLRIDLDYLFGVNHGPVRVFYINRVFDFTANGHETWIFNCQAEYDGIVFLVCGNEEYSFRIEIMRFQSANSGVNGIQEKNIVRDVWKICQHTSGISGKQFSFFKKEDDVDELFIC